MCGIAGYFSFVKSQDKAYYFVSSILRSQHTRGPDHTGYSFYNTDLLDACLGHNRLSIIDLNKSANQPFETSDGRYSIVFNGEIYNYIELAEELSSLGFVFSTKSDTEVLLNSYLYWGESCVNHFSGMFSFAIYDTYDNSLFLARDRFGVKPLYYWSSAKEFIFASTSSAIAELKALSPCIEYLARGLSYKYYEDDSSITQYNSLYSLEPGHSLRLIFKKDHISYEHKRYYDLYSNALKLSDSLASSTYTSLEERFSDLFANSCLLRLRSDVQVGISLSGGVDSSLIYSHYAEMNQFLSAFSYGHPHNPLSEAPLVTELTSIFSKSPTWISPRLGDLSELFWRTLDAQDAPFPHVSIMAQNAVFEVAHKEGYKVMLGGQGGDEAFMGYRKFFLFYLQSIIRNHQFRQIPQFLTCFLPLLPQILRRSSVFFAERNRYLGSSAGMEIGLNNLSPNSSQAPSFSPHDTLLERQVLDVTRFSLPTLLRYEDRNSMSNSIESRLPFLDHDLMEFGIALPLACKLNNGFGKFILRQYSRHLLPNSIRLNRDKRGFDVNQQAWLRSSLGPELRSYLNSNLSLISDFMPNNQSVDEFFSDSKLSQSPQAFKQLVTLIWVSLRS